MRQFSLQSILGLFVLTFFVLTSCNNEKVETLAASAETLSFHENAQKQSVLPPMQDLNVAYNNFEVNPNQAKTITLKNGSSIEIPANAFVDKDGNPVTESVQINYREFHNAAQIIASGIPMEVIGDKGERSWMQTAGMFEIAGNTKDGQEVYISEEKEVNVNMASYVDGEFPFWYFNPEKGNWEELGINTPSENPNLAKLAKLSGEKNDQGVVSKPIQPVKYDKAKPGLNFKINYDNFPELKQMKGIVWQYSGTDSKADPINNKWIFKESWDFANLEEGSRPNEYKIVLTNDEKTFVIPAVPSRKGKHFEKAMADFQKQSVEYKSYVTNRSAQKELLKSQAEFVRSFRVRNFGIFNYDILIKDPATIQVLADFDFGNLPNQVKRMVPVYLVTGEGRSVVAFPYENWDRFVFDPSMMNTLVAVLPGNKLATFSNGDFQKKQRELANADGGDYLFKMKIHETEVKGIDDIQHILNVMS